MPAALVRHLELRQQGDLAGAAAALAPRGPRGKSPCGPLLDAWCELFRGAALLEAGAAAQALLPLRAARQKDPSGPVAGRARELEARALLAAGRKAAAEDLIRPLAAGAGAPGAKLLLADALETQGKRAAAAALWREVFVSAPASWAGAQAAAFLEAAGPIELTSSEWLQRAHHLTRAGQAEPALDAAVRAQQVAENTIESSRATLARGMALARAKRCGEAEEVLSALAPEAPPEVQAAASLERARCALSRSDWGRARALFQGFVAAFPGSRGADEAAFLGAWTAFNEGDYGACAAAFGTFLSERPRAARAPEALWYQGFCSRLAGDWGAAGEALGRLAAKDGPLRGQALYWLGRQAESQPKAGALYRQAILADPDGWYGWLARMRLVEAGEALPYPLRAASPAAPRPSHGRERAAFLLAEAGLAEEARAELTVALRSVRGFGQAQRAASLASALGLYDLSYALARSHLLREAHRGHGAAARGLLFPRAYPEVVIPAAEAAGMDPYFAWAIMRRESAFKPRAQSPAQARGVMQLLLPVAQRIARGLGEAPVASEELYRPERSIPLAARLLSQLVSRFQHAALAAAAYNAGEDAVARWVSAHGGRPLDEWVELVPYRETRHYVKNVMADYFTYRALWSAPPSALPFSLEPLEQRDRSERESERTNPYNPPTWGSTSRSCCASRSPCPRAVAWLARDRRFRPGRARLAAAFAGVHAR